MSLIIGKDTANIDDLVDYYLPKPSIDRASIRMADILKQRFNQPAKMKRKEKQTNDYPYIKCRIIANRQC